MYFKANLKTMQYFAVSFGNNNFQESLNSAIERQYYERTKAD